MSTEAAAAIVFTGLFVCLAIGIPIAFTLILVGMVGIWLVSDWSTVWGMAQVVPFSTVSNPALVAIPLYLAMGYIISTGGVAEDIYIALSRWVGRLPGGLMQATIGGCAVFGAASGSSMACAAAFGRVSVPEMIKFGYDRKMTLGGIGAAANLAMIIPPSVAMILYGILTEKSIIMLFIAGIIPGVIEAASYMMLVGIRAMINPKLAPRSPVFPWRERFSSLRRIWPIVVLGVAILGSIYGGVATITEAAAVGGVAALLITLFHRKVPLRGLREPFWDTLRTSAMLFMILLGAALFTFFLTLTGFPASLAAYISSLDLAGWQVMFFLLLIYVLLGCIIDGASMLILTIPIVFPMITALHYDPIWFGIFVVKAIELGQLTPPLGLNCYVIAGSVPGVKLEEVFAGVLPYLLLNVAMTIVLIFFPIIATWLPSTM